MKKKKKEGWFQHLNSKAGVGGGKRWAELIYELASFNYVNTSNMSVLNSFLSFRSG